MGKNLYMNTLLESHSMSKPIQHLDLYPSYGRNIEKSGWLKKVRHRLIPRHVYLPLRNELRMIWLKLFGSLIRSRYRNAKDLLVNLGAGKHGKPGWINVDIKKEPGINCLYDCRKSLPFPDNSVKGIFCEHFLEHIDYTEEIPYFLTECHRVLKSGGIIRIIIPDLEKYLRAYCKEGWSDLDIIRQLDSEHKDPYYKNKYHTKMELVNLLFHQGQEHKFGYDHETLEFLLRRYGFSIIKRQKPGQSMMNELCLDMPSRASESLYIEAVKS